MDLSTVLGVALAWLFVGTAIYLGADGKAAALIDPTSFLVVLGGCTAATMAAFPFSDLKRLPKVLMKTVFWKSVDVQEVIDQAIELNTISRKGGERCGRRVQAARDVSLSFRVRGVCRERNRIFDRGSSAESSIGCHHHPA